VARQLAKQMHGDTFASLGLQLSAGKRLDLSVRGLSEERMPAATSIQYKRSL
jgi:hypothetical protein